MLTLLCAIAVQQQTVTFTHPCAHSSVVLEMLGEKMGVKMAPGGSVLQDYFAVKFTDRDPEAIKRLLATTLNAVWIQRGEYLVLDRGPKQHAEETRAENELLRKEIESFLAKHPSTSFDEGAFRNALTKAFALRGTGDPYRTAIEDVHRLSPVRLLAPNVVRAIGADVLLAASPARPLHYSWSSTGESDMPSRLERVVSEYVGSMRATGEIAGAFGDVRFGVSSFALDSKVTIECDITRSLTMVSINLLQSEELSKGLGSSSSYSLATFASSGAPTKPFEFDGLTEKLVLAGERQALVKLASVRGLPFYGFRDPFDTISQEVGLRTGSHLSEKEVLGIYGELPLAQVSEEKKLDYVALLPDELLMGEGWLQIAETAPLSEVWKAWSERLVVERDEDSGVLTIHPVSAPTVRELRFDRQAASMLVRRFVRDERLSIDALASFAVSIESWQKFFGTYNTCLLFIPVSASINADWAALTVYGSASPNLKREITNGGAVIRARNLSSNARRAIDQALLQGTRTYWSAPPNPPNFRSDGLTYSGQTAWKRSRRSIDQDSEVRVQLFTAKRLRPKFPSGTRPNYPSLADLASRTNAPGEYRPDLSQLAVVDVEHLRVDVYSPGLGYATFSVQLDSATDNTQFFAPSQLPEPWKSQLAEEIRKRGGGATLTRKPTVNHERAKR